MNKFKKITAAITTAAILATAAPLTGILPDVLSVTAFAGGDNDDYYDYWSPFYEYDENGLCIQDGELVSVSKDVISVVIPDSVTMIYDSAFNNCTSLTEIKVADGNPNYCSVEGVLYNKDKTTLECCPSGKSGIFSIPNSVTEIGWYAFMDCISLTSITIPDSVTLIRYKAFLGCTSLTSVTIPNSVTEIAEDAFFGCTSLTSITIPNSMTYIGYNVFNGCTSLTSVTIPNSVTRICGGAFSRCTNLTSVTIPNSITVIDGFAFDNCANLKDVYYSGSKGDWEKVEIEQVANGNKDLLNANIHFNSTDTPVTPTPVDPNPVTPNPVTPDPITPDPVNPAPEKVVYNAATDILGDVDGDGKTTARDATAILKYLVGAAEFEGNSLKNALVTGGEKPAARDATQVLKMLVSLA